MRNENNMITVSGKIVSDLIFSHEFKGEKFYKCFIEIYRLSGESDKLELIVSDRLLPYNEEILNKYVFVGGSIRTHNNSEAKHNKLQVSIFVETIDILNSDYGYCDTNYGKITGYICKKLPIRKTPLNRIIIDISLAVNRAYNKTDYVPCIAWGRTAKFIDTLPIGKKLNITGRLQSRNYIKDNAERTAYEFSIMDINEE